MFEIDNSLRKANMPVTIRFTEELHEQLHKLAAQYDVSFNLVVLQCCRYALNNKKDDEAESCDD